MYEQHWWWGLIAPVSWVEWHWCFHGWLHWAGNIRPVSGFSNMKAALVRSEQAVGTCLRVHVHSWAMWLELSLPWRKGKVGGQTGKKMWHFLPSLWRGTCPKQTDTDWFPTSLRGHSVCQIIAPLLCVVLGCEHFRVLQVITCCYIAILLIKSVILFFAYCMIFECFSSGVEG